MKYRNLKTGAVVESPCPLQGKNWETLGSEPKAGKKAEVAPVQLPDPPEEEAAEEPKEEPKPEKKPAAKPKGGGATVKPKGKKG